MLPSQEADRTRVGATCSRRFKAKVEDYAKRHNLTVSAVVIRACADLLLAEVLTPGEQEWLRKAEETDRRY